MKQGASDRTYRDAGVPGVIYSDLSRYLEQLRLGSAAILSLSRSPSGYHNEY
jgi:hypothetical protein